MTGSGPPPTGSSPLRLLGPERTALRRPDRNRWLLVDREDLEGGPLPLGLHIELARPDIGRARSAGAERALDSRGSPVPVLAVPAALVLLAGLGLAAAAGAGIFLGSGSLRPEFVGAIRNFPDLIVALLVVPAAFVLLRWVEASVVSSHVGGDGPLARWVRALPKIEPVAWRLGVPLRVPASVLVLAGSLYAAAAAWQESLPAPAAGAAAAALLYLIGALYPLEPGAGARILEGLTGIDDLPDRLRWSLVERFLPMRTPVEVEGTAAVAWAALALGCWAGGAGAVLYLLSLPPSAGAMFPGRLWQLAATAGLLSYTVWLALRTGSFAVDAVRLGSAVTLEPLTPPDELVAAWREDNPLLAHVEELEDAEWRWGLAPQGTLLTRYGAPNRAFYWLARGAVQVIGRSPDGDPLPEGTLGPGVGVGEVALLERSGRTADVVAARDCVVAVLDGPAFDAVADEKVEGRLRDVVLASRSLARSDVFWGLGPADRNRWLAHGRPGRHPAGGTLVSQGEEERWIGLVVDGTLSVEKDGDAVTVLEPDTVFGEMAYLDGGTRTATLRAREPALVWRWSPEWLDRALETGDLREALRALAEERNRESG